MDAPLRFRFFFLPRLNSASPLPRRSIISPAAVVGVRGTAPGSFVVIFKAGVFVASESLPIVSPESCISRLRLCPAVSVCSDWDSCWDLAPECFDGVLSSNCFTLEVEGLECAAGVDVWGFFFFTLKGFGSFGPFLFFRGGSFVSDLGAVAAMTANSVGRALWASVSFCIERGRAYYETR